MGVIKLFIPTVFFFLSGCAFQVTSEKTPLEIQSIQTKDFESTKSIVFASVLSVFQDLGYTIKSADKTTGFITAASAATSDSASKFWLNVSNVSQTSATAVIEQIGLVVRVRLNFVATSQKSSVYGQTDREDTPILDARVYRNAFERISNAIFIRSVSYVTQ